MSISTIQNPAQRMHLTLSSAPGLACITFSSACITFSFTPSPAKPDKSTPSSSSHCTTTFSFSTQKAA
ncbi:hypothetical protein MRB53_013330 [Persea americana]|uniref:Uncharacterized protein n=1 Tax=Persea americana TaxID=3435 RepID=A0ACC2K860_PERAE|nr:hypothetical protein MRB53_013330 [Persea americana]